MHLSYLGPVPCVFTCRVSSGLTLGGGCSLMVARRQVFFPSWVPSGLTSSHWRAESTDDCDILCLLIWQEIFHFSIPMCVPQVPNTLVFSLSHLMHILRCPEGKMHPVIYYTTLFTKLFLKQIPQKFCCIHWACAGPDLAVFQLIIQLLALRPSLTFSSCWLWCCDIIRNIDLIFVSSSWYELVKTLGIFWVIEASEASLVIHNKPLSNLSEFMLKRWLVAGSP